MNTRIYEVIDVFGSVEEDWVDDRPRSITKHLIATPKLVVIWLEENGYKVDDNTSRSILKGDYEDEHPYDFNRKVTVVQIDIQGVVPWPQHNLEV